MLIFRILWAGLLLFSQVATGQPFAYRAELGTVAADSFYRVLLPPAITGCLQPGFPDIRLYDRQKREVPYLLVREEPAPASQQARYLPVAGLAFRQDDNRQHRKTTLTFSLPAPLLIDQLVFTMSSPTLYHRQATLYQRGKSRRRRDYQPVSYFVLAANTSNVLRLSGLRARDFYVEIQNGDNPPLVVKKVVAYQLPTYLVAALEQGQTYHLAFGSQAPIPPPVYDLSYFRDRIPRQIPTLRPREIKRSAGRQEAKGHPLNVFFTSPYLIWAALLVVIAFLAFMSYKMLKETGKRG
jgi:hypothetical protein